MERLQKNDDILRTIRIIQIDEMLRCGDYVKIDSLVQKFEVSQRTIERDFERLRDDLKAPLEYDKSKNMYHYTDSTFSIPNVILTEGELFTVSTLFPLMEQYKNTPLESSFKNIMEKLVSFLPDTVSVNSSFLNQDISFISDPLPKINENIFNLIFDAIKSRKVLSIKYQSSKSQKPKEKTFDAYKVICQKGNWYVFGFEHETCDFRVYSLARIQNAELTNEFFKIPNDFDNNVSLGEDLSSTNENSTENSNENNEQNNQEEKNEENETNPDIKQIYWLPASDIKIRGFSNNTIKIPSSAQNDGIDYSRKLK